MERVNQRTNHLLGTNIKRLRIENNLRNKDIVAQLQIRGVEITTGTYSKIEMGLNNPSVDLLIALTDIFHCDYNAFFEKRYCSKTLKILASAIIFIFLIPYTASLYNGLSRLFGMAFDIDYSVCVIVMAVLTAIYVIAGGYMATAINDFIQGIIMIVGICAVIGAVLNSQGGFLEALNKLGQVSDPLVSDTPGVFNSFFGPDPVNLLGVVLLTSLGTWGLPQMVQKFYAIKSEQAINKGMIISTVFAALVAGGCYFLGGFGRLFSDRIDLASGGFDSIIPTMLSDLSPFLIAVVVILVLSASMSTLSSLVLTSSSTLTLDFIKGTVVKDLNPKKQLFIIRVFIAVFIIKKYIGIK